MIPAQHVSPTDSVAPLSLASAAAETVRWLLDGREAFAAAVDAGRIRHLQLSDILAASDVLSEQTYRIPARLIGALTGVAAPVGGILFVLADRFAMPVAVLLVMTDREPSFDRLEVARSVARQAAFGLECVGIAERSARLLAKEHLLAELGRVVGATLEVDAIVNAVEVRLQRLFAAGCFLATDESGRLTTAGNPAPAGLAACLPQLTDYLETTDAPAVLTAAELGAVGWKTDTAHLIVPLRSGGRLYGALVIPQARDQTFDAEDVDLAAAIGSQVAGPLAGAVLYAETQRLTRQLQRHIDRLAVLNQIARLVTTSDDQTVLWSAVVDVIRRGFGYPQVDLLTVDTERREMVVAASVGDYVAAPVGTRQHLNLGLLGRAARSATALRVPDVRRDPDYLEVIERAAIRSELVVPIVSGGRTLGLLNVESPVPAAFSEDDTSVLSTIADMLAGLIAREQLSGRAEAAAVLEERQRLARELHDSVSQQLFSMTLTAQAARSYVTRAPERMPALLERLQETAGAALAEMRALIHQLMPPALSDQGLVAALQHHAQELAKREQLHIALQVIGDDRAARGLELPIYRIVQEALNNIVKHAAAQHVQVELEFTAERILVRVTDDGRGFDVDARPSGTGRQFGLLTMRERAAELGGACEVRSEVGHGTTVTVDIPRQLRRAG